MDFGIATVDEGIDPVTGIRTIYRFEGDQVVCQRIYDAEPYLKRAQEMRERNASKRWGEGKEVGVLPPWAASRIIPIEDDGERERATKEFFRQNPAFLAYEPYLK